MKTDAPNTDVRDTESEPEADGLPTPRPTDHFEAQIWDVCNRGARLAASRRRAAEGATAHESPPEDSATNPELTPPEVAPSVGSMTGRTSEARIRAAARDLMTLGERAGLVEHDFKPGNEFPTPLTRLAIFRPSQRRKQQEIQDADNAVSFDTAFGKGRRLGPPLTTRDEDTLIALMRLRNRRLKGTESKLPANVRDIYQSKAGTLEIHRVVCTIDAIINELGLTDSGTNFKNTLASVKRLGAATIELERIQTGDGPIRGGQFKLIDVRWEVYDFHGLVDVVFPPLMAHWLARSYTYIDWQTRLQLSPLGKAIHRFLSGQKHEYTIGLRKLAEIIGYDGRSEHMKTKFRKALDELVAVGWLESHDIRGAGRSVSPWMLSTVRPKSTKSVDRLLGNNADD